jgi:hypothetical protein
LSSLDNICVGCHIHLLGIFLWTTIDSFQWLLVNRFLYRTIGQLYQFFVSPFSHLRSRSEADLTRPLFTHFAKSEVRVRLPLFTPVLTGVRQRSFVV